MRNRNLSLAWTAALLVVGLAHRTDAAGDQDTVTLPRWRYEELLRKEAELERLRSATAHAETRSADDTHATPPTHPTAVGSAEMRPNTAGQPPNIPLPALREGQLVPAETLALYFHGDAAGARLVPSNLRLQVRGRIAGFEKPLLTRNFHVLLETGQPALRIRCVVELPDELQGVYVAEAGTALMAADRSGARRPLLRVGQDVTVQGRLKGLKGQVIELANCRLTPTAGGSSQVP